MKAVIYARVSTGDQDTERQFFELTKLAKSDGYSRIEIFQDSATGDANKKDYYHREGFADMLAYIQENNINQIYCWELSRLGRTMIENHKIIKDFRERQINVYTQKEGINTKNNDANTQLQLNILSAIAEYELSTIKARTISGTYNSIRKGGVGGGSIKQFGYKKEAGKLVIDQEESAVIIDIVDKYLNKDWGVENIANYLNESGIETRMKKLVDNQIINYTRKSKLLWTSGSVARLFHKRLLTGFRQYGKVELQEERLRILDDETFQSLQLKMESKRKLNANAQKFENFLRGILVCGNCGGKMFMAKGTSKIQNHYKCFERFDRKGNCNAKMINIDLLNNVVYQMTKGYKVDSKDVAAKISSLENQIALNKSAINQIQADISNLTLKEDRLVGLYTNGQINLNIYEKQRKEITEEYSQSTEKITKLETVNIKLQSEINELSGKKIVDLENPIVFKSNIKSLVKEIKVKTLDDYDLSELNRMATHYAGKPETFIDRKNKRDIIYAVDIKMFDDVITYENIISNYTTEYEKIITVELI